MSFLNDLSEYADARGRIAPFVMILVGIIWLFTMPLNIDNMTISKGIVTKYDYSSILIKGYEKNFTIEFKKNKDLLKNKIFISKKVEIWTKKNSNVIKQIAIKGEITIRYRWWNYSKFPIAFISIGLLIILVTNRYKKTCR